jgi:hypothetical protein
MVVQSTCEQLVQQPGDACWCHCLHGARHAVADIHIRKAMPRGMHMLRSQVAQNNWQAVVA